MSFRQHKLEEAKLAVRYTESEKDDLRVDCQVLLFQLAVSSQSGAKKRKPPLTQGVCGCHSVGHTHSRACLLCVSPSGRAPFDLSGLVWRRGMMRRFPVSPAPGGNQYAVEGKAASGRARAASRPHGGDLGWPAVHARGQRPLYRRCSQQYVVLTSPSRLPHRCPRRMDAWMGVNGARPAPSRGSTGLAGVSTRQLWGATSCTRKAAPLLNGSGGVRGNVHSLQVQGGQVHV